MFLAAGAEARADALKERRDPLPEMAVRRLEIPVPAGAESPEEYLASKLGSRAAARRAVLAVAEELGLPPGAPRSVSAALALTRLGADLDRVARSLSWGEFEEYCASAVSAAGYAVRKNVRLRKPARQIDIVAESPSLVLSIDCKHWKRGAGAGRLEAPAFAQAERTRMYAESRRPEDARAFLPVLLTLVDSRTRVVGGVPVVPILALREFLASVSRFEEGLSFIRGGQAF
jgi:Restriction endonuclease